MKNDKIKVLDNNELFERVWPGERDDANLAHTPISKDVKKTLFLGKYRWFLVDNHKKR